jgi:hypothetical protein
VVQPVGPCGETDVAEMQRDGACATVAAGFGLSDGFTRGTPLVYQGVCFLMHSAGGEATRPPKGFVASEPPGDGAQRINSFEPINVWIRRKGTRSDAIRSRGAS